MGNTWRTINIANGLKHESWPCKPCSPIYAYASRRMRVCYCRLNISIKELMSSYFSGDVSDMIMIRHICALYTPNVLVYIHVKVIIVMIWLMYKEIITPPAPIFRSLILVSYVLWLPAWWVLWPPWPHFYQTRSAWSVDQGSNKNHSPAYNFALTVTKFCVMWEGLSLPHDTKFGNCRCKIVDSRAFPSWFLIHGLRWSGLIKAEPGDHQSNATMLYFSCISAIVYCCVLLEIKLTTTLLIWTFTGGSVAVLSRWLPNFSNSEQKPWSKPIRCHIHKEYYIRQVFFPQTLHQRHCKLTHDMFIVYTGYKEYM